MADADTKADTVERVSIPLARYQELIDSKNFLENLRGAGVDNWQGYDYAFEGYEELTEEQARELAGKE